MWLQDDIYTIAYNIIYQPLACLSWSANSIEPSQTARMCRLAWLNTDGQRLITFGSSWTRVKHRVYISLWTGGIIIPMFKMAE